MPIEGGTIVVTGGGTGIGRAVCLGAAALGAAGVAVGYSRSAEAARATVADLENAGCAAVAVRADVSSGAQVDRLRDTAIERLGRVDVLVNNAAITHAVPHADLDGLTDAMFHEILDVNVVGAFRCARAFAAPLRESGGHIVNIASISAFRAGGSSIAYGVSKAAMVQLTRNLAVALAPDVRVNGVAPGTVASRWQTELHGEERFAELSRAEREVIPLGTTTTPEQVARVVFALLEMDVVTGETLIADGGKHVLY